MFMLKQKIKKIFIRRSRPLSQSIGRSRISRAGALDVHESRERRDKIVAEKKTPKVLIRNNRFQWFFFHFFGRGKNSFFRGGGVITSNTILGHIQACPTCFLAQNTFVILRKRWPSNDSFLGRQACIYIKFCDALKGTPEYYYYS